MDVDVMKSLINITAKSADKNVIYKALIKLRTDFVKDKDGIILFYKEGGLAPLVRLINKPYEKILEVSLSILGNCCTMKDCCKQVMSNDAAITNGIVPPLFTILKTIPNPRIQCRACRLLGNLARESNEKICSLAKGVGICLASLLEDATDIQTITMAIRVVRLLWNELQFCEEFTHFGGVEKILIILVNHTKAKEKTDAPKSLVEKNSYEKEKVEFMRTNLPALEYINSTAFDHEMLKTVRPVVEDAFQIPKAPDQKELVNEIYRCLETLINTHLSISRVVENFAGNKDSVSCLICFGRDASPFRAQSLKILSNFSKTHGKSLLCTSDTDAASMACRLITTKILTKPLSESEERHCVSIICQLAYDACNRAKIRTSGAFKRILELAKNTTSDALLSMILTGLQHFRYDSYGIDLMIRMGLLNVLIQRLDLKTKDMKEEHNENSKPDNSIEQDNSGSDEDEGDDVGMSNPKRARIVGDEANTNKNDDLSLSSSMSICSFWSPTSSSNSSKSPSPRSFSPVRERDFSYEDLDDYSPVVSDYEDTNDGTGEGHSSTNKAEKVENFNLIDQILGQSSNRDDDDEPLDYNVMELAETEDTNPDPNTDVATKEKEPMGVATIKTTVDLIISVLCTASSRLSFIPYDSSLCTQDTLNTLVRACKVAFRKRSTDYSWDAQGAPHVLSHIISERNFVPLLKHDFVFQVYEMARPTVQHFNCDTCEANKYVGAGLLDLLNKIAETGYGRGEMAHLLLKADKQMNRQVSIISAMLIRDPKALNTLLLKHGGLYTLIDMILTKDEPLSKEAATGLTALALQLNIKKPKFNRMKISKSEFSLDINDIHSADNGDDFVTFVAGKNADTTADVVVPVDLIVTPTNSVRFSERILTETSDVFNRMFKSDFKESKDKRVVLRNQSIEGIKYFLDCVQQISVGKPLRKPLASTSSPANVVLSALEAYDICQIYMLPLIERNVLNMIVYMLNADNVLDVFDFSIRNHKDELREIAINFYLTSNLNSDVKVQIFRKADDSEYYKEWNELILDTIVYTCQNLIS